MFLQLKCRDYRHELVDGIYVGELPQLKACYSQGETIDELMQNIREVIELCLEELEEESTTEFIGIQKVVI
ncbi:MAG: type II toxin-antitoxin system HicB family antitoxin [Cyanobacteria bacterium J06592_8]